jgi:hypothetical protein
LIIKKEVRDRIVAQSLNEIAFARQFKQGKVKNWHKNEDIYYARKKPTVDSRTNIDLGRGQEYVHTLLSKIDNPLTFKFVKRKESQLKRAKLLNSLRQYDAQRDNWDLKDIVGKKQAIIYGRAIYSYFADSYDGYCPHLENVDVFDFLIDPDAGGIDMERAKNLGNYGVVKDKSELKKGVKEGIYLKYEVQTLIDGAGNAGESTPEETNKRNRIYDQNVNTSDKNMLGKDKYVFWQWYTTFEGERYYVLMNNSGCAIRIEKLSDIFESNLWPFWSWACFPDLTEFWTPSFFDYVREPIMGQAVSINQMFDNAEQINKPQKLVNVTAIENLAEVKYRKDGYIKVKGNIDLEKALQTVKVPSIDTPLKVYEALEAILEKSSGLTAASKGIADEEKVGIYEGNQANSADRFGYLNKSYSFGYKTFARLYENGVRENLTKKVAVDILGPDGVEVKEISRRDIFHKDDSFGIMVEASNAETALSEVEKRTKLAFLSQNAMNPIQSPKKAYELQASIAGFDEETIRQLQDTSEFGDADLMSEAERDIESIIDGKFIKPNQAATTAYKQRFVDYMRDNEEDIDSEQLCHSARTYHRPQHGAPDATGSHEAESAGHGGRWGITTLTGRGY